MKSSSSNLWPVVVLFAVVVAGVITLSALHIDVSAVAALVPVLLAAVAYVIQQLQTVKHQTNGNTSQLLDQLDKLTTALANSTPVQPAQTDVTAPGSAGAPVTLPGGFPAESVDVTAPEG